MILKSKTYIKLPPFWIFAQKTTFAWIDFPILLVCHSRDLSGTKTEENPSVAICGGSFCILTGLLLQLRTIYICYNDCYKGALISLSRVGGGVCMDCICGDTCCLRDVWAERVSKSHVTSRFDYHSVSVVHLGSRHRKGRACSVGKNIPPSHPKT
jgi:hypothetical protein